MFLVGMALPLLGAFGCFGALSRQLAGAARCGEGLLDPTSDYCVTLGQWRADFGTVSGQCRIRFDYVAGECADGTVLFLHSRGGYDSDARFYDAGSGEFITATSVTDVEEYNLEREPYDCPDPIVTEVICGFHYDIGSPAHLP
jgi:hypothetical protein